MSTDLGEETTCRSCAGPIAWRQRPTRGWLPLDPRPAEDGTVKTSEPETIGRELSGAELLAARAAGTALYRIHWPGRAPNCPAAGWGFEAPR